MDEPLLISLGSINADLQYVFPGELKRKGTARAATFSQAAGGKAANVAYFARRIGRRARLIGCVGRDYYADVALRPLEDIGVDLHLHETRKHSTGVAVVSMPKSGDKLILSAPNANMHSSDDYIEFVRQAVRSAQDGSILVCDFEIDRSVLQAAFCAAEERKFAILVDPTFSDQVKMTDLPRFRAATPNQQEAGELLGEPVTSQADAVAAAQALYDAGIEIACIKLDGGGAVVASHSGTCVIPAPQVRVRDKTGAGDAFISAMAIGLMGGCDAPEAARYGVAASSFSVTMQSAQASYPTSDELDLMMDRVAEAVSI